MRISLFLSYTLIALLLFATSCSGQSDISTTVPADAPAELSQLVQFPSLAPPIQNQDHQIGEYVRNVFQDKKGALWFGTLAKGLAQHDGNSLRYLTTQDGLIDNQINEIIEDKNGHLWLATPSGVSRYDGKNFTNYGASQGLQEPSCWSILADKVGNIWVGTMGGIYRYNGTFFSHFKLPESAIENPTFLFSTDLAWTIMQDSHDNIWIGTDGLGVYKYDGNAFINFTKTDGICSNNISSITEDDEGNIWISSVETRIPESEGSYKFIDSNDGGLSRYDGESFTRFPEIEGLSSNDIYPIYKDRSGVIWVASKHYGVYRYDGGDSFTNFKEEEQLTINCIQSILEDQSGNLWFGFSGGLFRLVEDRFINVTKDGPWP